MRDSGTDGMEDMDGEWGVGDINGVVDVGGGDGYGIFFEMAG